MDACAAMQADHRIWSSLTTAALLALMLGFFLFAPIATENGLGMAALWLACSQRAAMRFLAAPLASWTALTYGAGIAFVPAIARPSARIIPT